MLKAREIAVSQSFRPWSALTLTELIETNKDIEKITIPAMAFILLVPREIFLNMEKNSAKIKMRIKATTINTKIGFAKLIPVITATINIAAVVKVAPLRPVMPSFSSMSMTIKPITEP